MTEATTHTLAVPGATITYDVRRNDASTAPTLLLIGSPMGASGFPTLAGYLKVQPSLRIANPELAAQQFLGMVLAQNQLGLLLAGKPAAKSKAALDAAIDHAVELFLNGCRKSR